MDTVKKLAGKVLKVLGHVFVVFKYLEKARVYLLKLGDLLDNGKLDNSYKG